MKTSRRDFIKITSLTAAGIMLTPQLAKLLADNGYDFRKFKRLNLKRFPTYCEICFWKCAGWVYTDEKGEIWKIIGNDEDPHCNGRLCPRGTGGVGMYYDEDRLKTTLIRTSDRGKQTFRVASWDEAFDYISKKLKFISEKYGPETVALFTHGSGGKLLTTFMKAYGSDTIAGPSYAQCKGPR